MRYRSATGVANRPHLADGVNTLPRLRRARRRVPATTPDHDLVRQDNWRWLIRAASDTIPHLHTIFHVGRVRMPEKRDVPIKQLSLDLRNFRTVQQPDELEAVRAMISTRPDYFWALTNSLLESGFLPTENVIVLKLDRQTLSVREGNRRVAAMKLIHGLLPINDLNVPAETERQIGAIGDDWLKANSTVPCVIYGADEAAVVARIVRLAHGKGEKAGRDQWNAVARARHNRDENHATEAPLDLLEKYLANGRNITHAQAARWAGEYPLSVLEEAMKKIAPRLQMKGPVALAAAYPTIAHREAVERIAHDIGMQQMTFPLLRQGDPIETAYGIAAVQGAGTTGKGSASGGSAGSKSSTKTSSGKTATAGPSAKPPKAIAINDPRAVTKTLKQFQPRGNNREKLVALKDEAVQINIAKTPMAFCFVLRSMFELSANAYVVDQRSHGGPSPKKPDGKNKTLAELLREIKTHLIGSGATKNKEMERALHGASTELGSKTGFLSVTSLNQLVHNQSFSVTPQHIAVMFGNVFPLLEAMNT